MEFVTNINVMMRNSDEFFRQQRALTTCKAAVQRVKVNYAGINSTLRSISEEIEKESQWMQQMARVLESSTLLYQKYEEQNAKMDCRPLSQNDINSIVSPTGQGSNIDAGKDPGTKAKSVSSNASTWWKFISNVGPVGAAVSVIGSLITGNGSAKDYISSAKYFVSAVGSGAVAVSKGGAEGLKYAFGLNDGMSKINTSSFGSGVKSYLSKQLDDLNFAKAEGKVGTFKTATKWAGYLLTVAGNGVENYKELKEDGISASRAVQETVIESAVDIALGIGAAAVTTGVLSALGFVAAPAVVVGLGATLITVGANAICKWATGGKDIGEVVADTICNIGDGISKIKNKAKKAIKSKVSAAWRGICGAFG